MRMTAMLLAAVGLLYAGSVAQAADANKVRDAVQKGTAYLWTQQDAAGHWETNVRSRVGHPLVSTSMATYALLEAGVSPDDPRLRRALDWLEQAVNDPQYAGADSTYTLGFRCQVWLTANQSTGNRYANALRRDIQRLTTSTPDGGYDYLCTGRPEFGAARRADHSNSQYALYGVWAGKLGEVAIDRGYWQKVLGYWMTDQHADGSWGYLKNEKQDRITMTTAGCASLMVCYDAVNGSSSQANPAIQSAIDRSLAYLDKSVGPSLEVPGGMGIGGARMYYHLFGVQRVGMASGRKRFGSCDWYDSGAGYLLKNQRANGAWSGEVSPVVCTSWAVMFLARGQEPLPFVRLDYGSDSRNHPQAVAHFDAWMASSLQQRVRQQTVSLTAPAADLADSKALLITGDRDPGFTAAQVQQLKAYVGNGGTLVSTAEANGVGFQQGMRRTYREIFPWHVLKPLARNHPVYSARIPDSGSVPLYGIQEGSQLLAIHTDHDLTGDWQSADAKANPASFRIAANIAQIAQAAPGKRAWLDLDHRSLAAMGVRDDKLVKAYYDYDRKLRQLETSNPKAVEALRAAAPSLSPERVHSIIDELYEASLQAIEEQHEPILQAARAEVAESVAHVRATH